MRKCLQAVLLALGLAMFVWGGRAFTSHPHPNSMPAEVEDGVADLSHDVIGSPSIGDTIKGLVTGPVGRNVGALTITCAGLALAAGAILSLVPKSKQA
jgi:hypothetical protein